MGGQSLCDEDIQALKHEMAKGGFAKGEGTIESRDVVSDYVADVLSRVRISDKSFKVVVDAGTVSVPLLHSSTKGDEL